MVATVVASLAEPKKPCCEASVGILQHQLNEKPSSETAERNLPFIMKKKKKLQLL